MEVFDRQQLGLALFEPLGAGEGLALRAVSIPAAFVSRMLVATGVRLLQVTAEGGGPAEFDGAIDRSLWEIGLALAVRDALRSGALYLPRSRHHVSFSHLIYSDDRWERERKGAYEQLALFSEGDEVVAHLTKEFEDVAHKTAAGMAANQVASVSEGGLKLHRRDTLEVSDRVLKLRRLIETSLPPVRIEALLREVDSWCGFSREFRPLIDALSRSGNLYSTLLAALIAHGTNLGIAAMGQSAPAISVDMLQYVSRWFLREETLKAANAVLVVYHHRLPLSAVWRSGAYYSHGNLLV